MNEKREHTLKSHNLFAVSMFKMYNDNFMILKGTIFCFNNYETSNLCFTTRREGGLVKENALQLHLEMV